MDPNGQAFEVEELLSRAGWLALEIDALKDIIDQIPLEERLPDQPSVVDWMNQLFTIQKECLLPIFREASTTSSVQPLSSEIDPVLSQEQMESGDPLAERHDRPVTELLESIASDRRTLVELAKGFSEEDWARQVQIAGGRKSTLAELLQTILQLDRDILKKAGEQVMVFQKESQSRRDLNRRRGGVPSDSTESETDSMN